MIDSEFLEESPLYRRFVIDAEITLIGELPSISMACSICEVDTNILPKHGISGTSRKNLSDATCEHTKTVCDYICLCRVYYRLVLFSVAASRKR